MLCPGVNSKAYAEELLNNKKLNKRVTVRLDQELYTRLTWQADLDNISVGKLCRNLLKKELENEKNKR